jgi:hypothetical protein
MGVDEVKIKLRKLQASYDMDALKKLTLEEISPIVKEFGFNEADLSVLQEVICEKQVDKKRGGGRSSTRKNRLKKKRTKKNKTQRGGEFDVYLALKIAAALAFIVVASLHESEYKRRYAR